jgi:hypothetical protein
MGLLTVWRKEESRLAGGIGAEKSQRPIALIFLRIYPIAQNTP